MYPTNVVKYIILLCNWCNQNVSFEATNVVTWKVHLINTSIVYAIAMVTYYATTIVTHMTTVIAYK